MYKPRLDPLVEEMRQFQLVFRLDGSSREVVAHNCADDTSAKNFALNALQSKLSRGGGVGTVSVGRIANDGLHPVRWLGSWELSVVSEAAWTPWREEQAGPRLLQLPD